MALPTTTVSGTIYDPSGDAVEGGTIRAELSAPGSVDDETSGVTQKVFGAIGSFIGTDGSVSLDLVPNDEITPDNTNYLVTITLPDGTQVIERWEVPSTPDPIEIGDVPRVSAVDPQAHHLRLSGVTALPDVSTATAGAIWHQKMVVLNDGTNPEQAWICLIGGDGGYHWAQLAIAPW